MSKIEKSYEYKNIQVPKLKESMRRSAKRHYDYDKYYPRYWDHGCEIIHNIRIVARKMIEKGIGKPYTEIYSKFIKRYPESKYYISCDPKDIFKENFSSRVLWNNVYEGDFYLDENYIIRKREREPIKVNNKKGIKFKWNKKAYPITHSMWVALIIIFKSDIVSILEREYSRQEIIDIYKKIKDNSYLVYKIGSSDVNNTISSIETNSYIIDNENDKRYEKQLFIPTEFEEIEYPTCKYLRNEHYKRKRKHKQYLKYIDWKNSYDAEVYLRTYKLKQKLKSEEENDINIERLGFDKLISFKGIEYHGQKRKRKNSL